MEISIGLGLLAGFAFLLTFNNLPGYKSVVWATVIMCVVAVGYEASSMARNRMNARPYSAPSTRLEN